MARAAQADRVPAPPPPPDDELFAEPPRPDARSLRRAAVLAAVVTRGLIECDDLLPEPAAVMAAISRPTTSTVSLATSGDATR